jgi:hypothetical protein
MTTAETMLQALNLFGLVHNSGITVVRAKKKGKGYGVEVSEDDHRSETKAGAVRCQHAYFPQAKAKSIQRQMAFQTPSYKPPFYL